MACCAPSDRWWSRCRCARRASSPSAAAASCCTARSRATRCSRSYPISSGAAASSARSSRTSCSARGSALSTAPTCSSQVPFSLSLSSLLFSHYSTTVFPSSCADLYRSTYDSVVANLIPLVLVTVSTVVLIRQLQVARHERRAMIMPSGSGASKSSERSRETQTDLLVALIALCTTIFLFVRACLPHSTV